MYRLIDIRELRLGELTDSILAEPDLIMMALLSYHLYYEDFYFEKLVEDMEAGQTGPDVGTLSQAIDSWYCEYMDRIERMFGHLRNYRRHAITDVKVNNDLLLLTLQPTDTADL